MCLLFWLRMVAVVSQALVIAAVHGGHGIALPLGPLALAICGLAGWNAVIYWRLRRLPSVSHGEVAVNLAVDTAVFTAVIYLTGSPTNPFVSLYLVPIALAAPTCQKRAGRSRRRIGCEPKVETCARGAVSSRRRKLVAAVLIVFLPSAARRTITCEPSAVIA